MIHRMILFMAAIISTITVPTFAMELENLVGTKIIISGDDHESDIIVFLCAVEDENTGVVPPHSFEDQASTTPMELEETNIRAEKKRKAIELIQQYKRSRQ